MLDPLPLTHTLASSVVQEKPKNMTAQDSGCSSSNNNSSAKTQAVVFTGHNAYMMSVARMNRDTSQFTDVVLVCPDGKVTAHRLVLAAASSTLRKAFLEVPANDAMPEGMHEHTILVPDVKKSVVAGLVDFLYTVNITRGLLSTLQGHWPAGEGGWLSVTRKIPKIGISYSKALPKYPLLILLFRVSLFCPAQMLAICNYSSGCLALILKM